MIILAVLRLILFALSAILYIIVVFILSIFVGDKTKASTHLRRPTINIFLWVIGVRTKMTGTLPDETVLFVGNHISYLDPFILVQKILAWPVAKMEIASWPLIGYMVSISGVIFVKRRQANSLRQTRVAIAEALRRGDSVIVYPEGTTTDGHTMLPFQRGVFDIAANENIPVVPVTIFFENPDAAFLKKQAFLPHFLKLFSTWRNRVDIHFGEKIRRKEGREILEVARQNIEEKLKELRPPKSL